MLCDDENDYSYTFKTNEAIPFYDISSTTLEKICQFLYQRTLNINVNRFQPLYELDASNPKGRKEILELLLAADYLDC
jgi:hypothetical protein